VSYVNQWVWAPIVMGAVGFLCVPSFALLGLALIVIVAAAGLVAPVSASIAAPVQ